MFFEFASSPEQAVKAAQNGSRRAADVLVFPYGGITYPAVGK